MSQVACCFHEASHIVIAKLFGERVLRAVAGRDEAGVRTFYRRGRERAFITIDLAGGVAERILLGRDPDPYAIRADEANALRRAEEYIRRFAADADVSAEASKLVEGIRAAAEIWVEGNWPQIERVAAALADGAVLNETDIDALFV